MKKHTYTILLVSASILLAFSCARSPVETILPVVNRVMNETLFELEEVPVTSLEGLHIINLSNIEDSVNGEILLRGELRSSSAGKHLLGISSTHTGRIQIGDYPPLPLIKGMGFRETDYGRYESDTLLELELDTNTLEQQLQIVNEPGARIFLAEMNAHADPQLKFSPWEYKRDSSWKALSVGTQSRIKEPAGRYFQREAYNEWTYANGILWNSVLELAAHTGDEDMGAFVTKLGEFTINTLPQLYKEYHENNALRTANYRMFRKVMLDDTGAPTLACLELYRIHKHKAYLDLAEEMVEYVRTGQQRLEDGTFSRSEPAESSIWADDLFMSTSLLLKYYQVKPDQVLLDDVIKQILNMHKYLWDEEKHLHRHGYFALSGEQSPVCWTRANGWFIWSVANALQVLPAEYPGRDEVLEIYQRSIDGLVARQGENGLWHQILTSKKSWEETSGTAMFTLAIARGVNNSWLSNEYVDYARKGWEGICTRIEGDRILGICQGTGIGMDEDFYLARKRYPNDPRGLGAVISCAIEMDKLL